MTLLIFSLSEALTVSGRFKALDTVAVETFAAAATSLIVTAPMGFFISGSGKYLRNYVDRINITVKLRVILKALTF